MGPLIFHERAFWREEKKQEERGEMIFSKRRTWRSCEASILLFLRCPLIHVRLPLKSFLLLSRGLTTKGSSHRSLKWPYSHQKQNMWFLKCFDFCRNGAECLSLFNGISLRLIKSVHVQFSRITWPHLPRLSNFSRNHVTLSRIPLLSQMEHLFKTVGMPCFLSLTPVRCETDSLYAKGYGEREKASGYFFWNVSRLLPEDSIRKREGMKGKDLMVKSL